MSPGTLRRGYTTGACAQAATAAAARRLESPEVTITLPSGERADFSFEVDEQDIAWVVKDAGDDPDVTDGLRIGARVEDLPGSFELVGGEGVGTVTLAGLPVPPGEPAVNPVPREAILAELRAVRPGGARVTLFAPGGDRLARKTLNPRLGVIGGISILGTSGRVEPWSIEAMRDSLVPQLDVAAAAGRRSLVFVVGAKGRKLAEAAGGDPVALVEVGNELGWMLEQAAERHFESVLLRGHVGKLAKLAARIFDTHSRVADARTITLAAYAGAGGVESGEVRRLIEMPTAEEAAARLLDLGRRDVLDEVARAAAAACRERYDLPVTVVMLDRRGNVVGSSESGA